MKNMKRGVALVMVMVMVLGCTIVYAADYSFMDSMTLEELQQLDKEVEKRIDTAKKAAANDPSNFGIWEIRYYLDEFNMPTEDGYVSNKEVIKGKFSNSATTDSDLGVWLYVDDDPSNPGIIRLMEYGRNIIKNPYREDKYYKIAIRLSDGTKKPMQGVILANNQDIYVIGNGIIDVLSTNTTVSFYIEEDDNPTTHYLFTIEDTTGFANAYKELTGAEM